AGDRGRTRELDVEQAADQALGAADLDDVAEALGRDDARLRALALEQRVGGDGRAVHEGGDVGVVDAELGERFEHAAPLAAGDGRDLRRKQGVASRVVAEHVGEGAADVDADAVSRGSHQTTAAARTARSSTSCPGAAASARSPVGPTRTASPA